MDDALAVVQRLIRRIQAVVVEHDAIGDLLAVEQAAAVVLGGQGVVVDGGRDVAATRDSWRLNVFPRTKVLVVGPVAVVRVPVIIITQRRIHERDVDAKGEGWSDVVGDFNVTLRPALLILFTPFPQH